MIFLKRRRLFVWLIKAYVKRWGKGIALSFVVALLLFSILLLNLNLIVSKIPFYRSEAIGISGVYTTLTLPPVVLNSISRGLTKVSRDGTVLPDVAKSWQVKKNGKEYVFNLYDGIYFADGKELDSSDINYDFSDVSVSRPSKDQIVFSLKDSYSPFLVTVATHKIFRQGIIGVGDFKIQKIKLNGDFVQSIELFSEKDRRKIVYYFYPTQESLKTAFALGEVNKIYDLNDLSMQRGITLANFKNGVVKKDVNYGKLATLFYNNNDPVLSDKKIRKALSYSLPQSFPQGERTNAPYDPKSWVNAGYNIYEKDDKYAKLLFSQSSASESSKLVFIIKSLPQYEETAKEISKSWKEIGINSKIEIVDGVPTDYQIFLGEFLIPEDPDQYTLWHSKGGSNISGYKSLRIDKLLEDGRKTVDIDERKKIYADFQKYLLDDQPAAFLYFPYSYSVTRI